MPLHNNAPTLEEVMQRLANEKDDSPDRDMALSWIVARNIVRVFSIIPRVLFLRAAFGERYMQAYHIAVSWLIVAFAVAGASFSSVTLPWAEGPSDATAFGVFFLIAYSVMLGLRFYGVLRRRWANDFSVHSYSEGSPWWLWEKLGLHPALVGLVLEPLIILIAGFALARAVELPSLQFLAWVVAIAHFVEQQIIAAKERAQLLDAADNLIDQRMAQARLGTVRRGQQPVVKHAAAPAVDQRVLQQVLEQVRSQATANGSSEGGE